MKHRIDKIYKLLAYIWLRWPRTSGVEGHLSLTKKFAFVPLESIWGSVHIVRRDSAVSSISRNDHHSKEANSVCEEEKTCEHEIFNLIGSSLIVLKSLTRENKTDFTSELAFDMTRLFSWKVLIASVMNQSDGSAKFERLHDLNWNSVKRTE